MIRAALMWNVNDFLTHDMLSGYEHVPWTHCPHYMEQKKAFTLKYTRKGSRFDSGHRFLPNHHPFRMNKNTFRKREVERDESSLISTHLKKFGAELRILQKSQMNVCFLDWIDTKSDITVRKELYFGIFRIQKKNYRDTMCAYWEFFLTIYNTMMNVKDKTKGINKTEIIRCQNERIWGWCQWIIIRCQNPKLVRL